MADSQTISDANAKTEADIRSERYREIRKVTLIGSVFDLGLGIAKILIGWLANSQALIADGIHSLSDLATDIMVIWAAKHAHSEADDEHPYGHGRIETVATVGLGLALLAVSVGIAYEAVQRMFMPVDTHPGVWALVVAFLSVVFKEGIYHYTMWAARKYRSNMLRANAWHSRTDAISSIVVIIGLIGTMAGLTYLDAVAAVLVAVMIGKISWDLVWHSIQEFMDAGLEEERVMEIRGAILQVDGVRELHMLRTRRLGPDALVDVHVLVGPHLSISEGHHIAEAVRRQVIENIDEVTDVMVHVDPEDDEKEAPCCELPLRGEVLKRLHKAWSGMDEDGKIEDVTLHYLDGRIDVDVILPISVLSVSDAQAVLQGFRQQASALKEIGKIRVAYR